MVGKRPQPKGGSRKGRPNKVTADIKNMVLTALNTVGGAAYLARQAEENPGPFMALVGKVLPLQVTGEGGGALEIRLVKYDADDNPTA